MKSDPKTGTKTPDPPGFAVRAARPGDEAALAAYRAAAPGDAPVSRTGAHFDEDAGVWVWVVEEAATGRLVGAVTLERVSAHAALMSGLSVRAELRGRGLGRRLVREALQHCGDNGLIKVRLDAFGDQKVAIALFQRFGFQLSRTRQVSGRDSMEFYLDLYRRPGAGRGSAG